MLCRHEELGYDVRPRHTEESNTATVKTYSRFKNELVL